MPPSPVRPYCASSMMADVMVEDRSESATRCYTCRPVPRRSDWLLRPTCLRYTYDMPKVGTPLPRKNAGRSTKVATSEGLHKIDTPLMQTNRSSILTSVATAYRDSIKFPVKDRVFPRVTDFHARVVLEGSCGRISCRSDTKPTWYCDHRSYYVTTPNIIGMLNIEFLSLFAYRE